MVPLTEKRLIPVVKFSITECTTFPSRSSNSVQMNGGTVGTVGVGIVGIVGVGGSVEPAGLMMGG